MDTSKDNNYRYSSPVKVGNDILNSIRVEKLISLIKSCEQLLDVGCWDGFLMKRILSFKKAQKVFGVDNSSNAIKLAKKKGLDAKLIKSADEVLPFSKDSFDCVVAGELIEHLYDVDSFLSEVHRILKKGGQLVLTTPNLSSLGNRLELLRGNMPWQIENRLGKGTAGHIRYFTDKELCGILAEHGFRIISINTDVLGFGKKAFTRSDFVTKRWPYLGRILIVNAQKN